MKLDENYQLTHDSNCWRLGYFKTDSEVPSWETYHMNCKQALEKYIDCKMKEVDGLYPIWIDEWYKAIESSYNKIKNL